MTKERRFLFSTAFCLMAAVPILLGACLNPLNFTTEDLPRIPVEVTGKIDVTITDVAVFWLINRTKNVDVTSLTINRPQGEGYPKTYTGKPVHGTSLASYHQPMEDFYAVAVSTAGASTKAFSFEVQFPRADNYKYYLYWTQGGDLVLVDENRLTELPPDPNPDKNDLSPGPNPAADDLNTMIVFNVTRDQNIDEVEFSKDSSFYSIIDEPTTLDQQMIRLGAGSYGTKVTYTRGGTQRTIGPKNSVVTREDTSMSVRTNFLYFYKTKTGDYSISQTWPPIPNDASDENSPEDALDDTQGILEIRNNAIPNNPHALIARILINGDEHPNTTNTSNYMGPGDPPKRYILPRGPVFVAFRPTDQTFYGQESEREILSKQVITLSYINDLGNPWVFPEAGAKGSGLIRIVNKSTGVVTSAAVYNIGFPTDSINMGYLDFSPPFRINYNQTGLVPVVGTDAVPLNTGLTQLIQVILETTDGLVAVERVGALNNSIVEVEITSNDLKPANRIGSKVKVTNSTTTPTTILGMYVYNTANPTSSAAYGLDVSSPPPGANKEVYVLSSPGLPILQNATYKARLTVYGNGNVAVIEKDFSPDGLLYSEEPDKNLKTITLGQGDLPASLIETFTPITGITTLDGAACHVNTIVETDLDGGNPAIKVNGHLVLDHFVKISPDNASKKSPIIFTESNPYVVIEPTNNILTVTGIAPAGSREVIVNVKIEDAAGTLMSKTDFFATIPIVLDYMYVIRTKKATSIGLDNGTVQEGQPLDLQSLATLQSGLNITGIPITKSDLVWYINGSQISGSIYTAGSTGTVQVKAVLPADKNGGTQVTSPTRTITITAVPVPFVPVSGVTGVAGSLVLHYNTQSVGSGPKTLISGTYQLDLTGSVTVQPANATKQSPINWALSPVGGVILNNGVLSVTGLPGSNTVTVTASIANATSNGSGNFSASLPVTLVEHHSKLVGSGQLSVADNTDIFVGDNLDLASIATISLSGAYLDYPYTTQPGSITKDDLVWSITSGSSYATLNGGILRGTAAGSVTVRATLPANKNGGTEVSATGTVTVKAVTPATFTLRIIKQNDSDYVSQIALVPVNVNYSNAIYSTGRTKVRWAFGSGKKGITTLSEFKKAAASFPGITYTGIAKLDKTNDWTDVTIEWPTDTKWPAGTTGFNIFFIEGDSRVRGYVNPGQLDPDQDKNFLFYLRPAYLYDNYRLWMKADKQANANASDAFQRIPIGYDSNKNTASVMKAQGVGKQPRHDLSDY
jgi:hypothetical protein